MKAAIVFVSKHHGNTERIAEAMADVLNADLFTPENAKSLEKYDLIGFGSGIEYWKHYRKLFDYVETLPQMKKKAFIFSTSGVGGVNQHAELKKKLIEKGFEIIGEFACKAFDTWLPLKVVGGINKGKPDGKDVESAKVFARSMV